MNPHDEQNLERLVHQALRTLPPRRAPRSLEARVFAEIERRAALPWWRQGIAHWPVGARVLGLGALAGIAWFVLVLTGWITADFGTTMLGTELATQSMWLRVLGSLARTLFDSGATVLSSIPAVWLYGGGFVVAVLYAALVGIGALAYRTLYASR